jgi:hypothetical protein
MNMTLRQALEQARDMMIGEPREHIEALLKQRVEPTNPSDAEDDGKTGLVEECELAIYG